MTARTCLHCSATLSPQELEYGWCEGCGKRLPLSFRSPDPAPPASESAPREPDGWDAVVACSLFLPGCALGVEIGYILAHLFGAAEVEWWCVIGGVVGLLLTVALVAGCLVAPAEGRLTTVLLATVAFVYAAPVFGAFGLTIVASLGASGRGSATATAVALLVGGLYGIHVSRSKDEPVPPTGGAPS